MSEGLPERIKLHQIQGGEDLHGPAGVAGRLLASWQRSEDYGISLEAVKPVFTGTERLGVEDDLFFQCGNEVLTDLHRTLSGEPVSMMLTDADGVVLSRLSGDRQLLAALDQVYPRTGVRLRRAKTSAPTVWGWRSPTGHPPWSAPTSITHRT